MKYFAILKDSLREALDSKVLYVLIALATVSILFVASLSFKPLSADRTMAFFFAAGLFDPPVLLKELNARKPERWAFGNRFWLAYNLAKVELLRGEADSAGSDYVLTVNGPSVQMGAEKSLADLRKLFSEAEDLGYIKLGEIETVASDKKNGASFTYRVPILSTPESYRIWATTPSVMFGAFDLDFFAYPLSVLVYRMASYLIGFGSWVAVIMGIIITSFFIPNMLRKGTIDLLLVKPINRFALLTYKYLGGLTFILVITSYAIGGIWLALGMRSGLWANGALLLIATLTFFFAILYSVSALVGVVTRSVVTSIILTMFAWVVFFIIGLVHSGFEVLDTMEKTKAAMGQPKPESERWGDGWTAATVHAIHAITPRTADLNNLNDLIVFTDFMTGNLSDMGRFDNSNRNWTECLIVSTIWICIFLGFAMAWFYFTDY